MAQAEMSPTQTGQPNSLANLQCTLQRAVTDARVEPHAAGEQVDGAGLEVGHCEVVQVPAGAVAGVVVPDRHLQGGWVLPSTGWRTSRHCFYVLEGMHVSRHVTHVHGHTPTSSRSPSSSSSMRNSFTMPLRKRQQQATSASKSR